jgi:anthranilate/para-aminobenzoate synthase component II
MNKCVKKKNILHIKNFDYGKNLDYLKTFSNVHLHCIMSIEIIDYNIEELKKFIEPFDIIILGGGPQHLTTNNYLTTYLEIKNQIEIVKLVSGLYCKEKLLIGICLGCQIIGLSFGLKVIDYKKQIIGFGHLDTNTIDHNFINNSNTNYLNKLDFNLLSESFSFHSDYVNFLNDNKLLDDKLNLIAQSTKGHPYLLTNNNLNIYGFQFHPEISLNSILDITNLFPDINKSNLEYSIDELKKSQLEKIYKHFFDIFINN